MPQELVMFRFVEQLDENDRFRVIRGIDAREGHAVVLKQLRRSSDVTGLERELAMLRSLQLPGVVRALRTVATPGAPSLMLEDGGGQTLERHIAAGGISFEAKLGLAVRLAAIVEAIHGAGVVNRNLRPSTILWNAADGQLEVLDFSLATRATRDVASPTLPDAFVGSAHYIAPEQTGRLDLVVDRRSDLYALGAIFYYLFVGRPPFEESDVAALVHAHIARIPERADKIVPGLPLIVGSIIAKLLRKDPDERYQTAIGLERDLGRALAGWHGFELGADDAPTVLRVRDALVGREAELGQLQALTRELAAGRRVIAYIQGEAGGGKSALLLEFARCVVTNGGVFARGKFDLAIVASPYQPIAQILEALAATLLGLPRLALEALRDRLDASMPALAPALVDVFPAIRPLFRTVAALETISPAGSRNRLIAAFLAFVAAVAPAHPMTVLALDDLQWADDASLTLLEALVQDSSIAGLGFLLAARDAEVVPGSRVERVLASLEASGAQVERLAVAPLPREAVATILADSLRSTTEQVKSLAQLVWEKTHGNPFFVRALLESAVDRGFVRYESGFIWNEAAIAASPVTENVAALLSERLRDLPDATREALTIAARIGDPIECDTVASTLGVDEHELLATLGPAFERGVILRAGSAVRFAHDRLVEAALALASPERARAIHARLSAVLLERGDERQCFKAVDHLWLSGEPEGEAGRARRSSLALAAARRAHAARAFGAADLYFERYASTMDSGAFEGNFEETFDAHVAWAEAAFLAGSYARAERLCEELVRRARNPTERLRGRRILISYYEKTSRFVEAIRLSFATLADIGVVLPDYEAISPTDIEAEIAAFLERFGRVGAGSLPICSSGTTREAIAMLVDVATPLWSARAEALPYVLARAATLSLEAGLSPASGTSLVVLGSMLCIALGDATVGTATAKLGLEVQERVGSADYEVFSRYAYSGMVQFHSESALLGREGLLASYHRSLAVGSRRWAAASMETYALRGALVGLPLTTVAEEVADGRLALLRLEQEGTLTYFEAVRHFVERVLEREETPWDLGPRRTDGASAMAHFREANHGGLIATHATLCMLELLAAGHDHAAYALAKAEQEYLLQPRGQLQTELGIALLALVLARCAPEGDATADTQIARAQERFERSARFEATSFAGYLALVEAARLDRARSFDAAWVACDRAIDVFERDSVLHLLAITNELAARIHRRAGNRQRVVRFYQEAAHDAYERWGAPKAVRRLEAELGLVTGSSLPSPNASHDSSQVDIVSLLKATRAIASEIELDQLVTTLLRIVAENAGANRAYLFLDGKGSLELEARCDAELSVTRAPPEERSRVTDAPFALATVALRRREVLMHKDVSILPQFASDPYLARRGRVASLAAPIERLGKVVGVIVLENDLVSGAFTPHHARIVVALNAQIAIALENANLYEGLRASAEEMRQLYTRLATVEDDERRALHAELHDQVGANLSALRLSLEIAMSLLARAETTKAQQHLASAHETAAETIAIARDLMAELRPPALDDYGVLAALRSFAETQSMRLSLRVDVRGHDLSPRPTRFVEDALFRIAQEAVINAARHASASHVVIELRELDTRVELTIADDGVGFDPAAPAAGLDHWGLKNMKERARAVGGELRITTAPGAGTRISAVAPRMSS